MQPLLAAMLLYLLPGKNTTQLFIRSLPAPEVHQVLHPIATPAFPSPEQDTWEPYAAITIVCRYDFERNNPARIAQPGDEWLIYPVPVQDLLNLRYNGKEPIRGVINVIIRHINGRVFHKLRFASLTRWMQIPVGNLGRGTYHIRVVINDKVVWDQPFVK